ncbi:MAG: hypothetical protein U1E62_21580 [Alsobacter sp.]
MSEGAAGKPAKAQPGDPVGLKEMINVLQEQARDVEGAARRGAMANLRETIHPDYQRKVEVLDAAHRFLEFTILPQLEDIRTRVRRLRR